MKKFSHMTIKDLAIAAVTAALYAALTVAFRAHQLRRGAVSHRGGR